ncbi:MAG: PAS domain S-box protein [Spirochaetales bacterium]|nr:PAS domain S-box protein [Spirochaetales bacterium]
MLEVDPFSAIEYFSAVFLTSPDHITVSRYNDGTYLMVNEAFLRSSGYSSEEVIGKTSVELGLWVEEEGRHQFLESLRTQRKAILEPVKFRAKNQEIRFFQLAAAVARVGGEDCIVAISRDITEEQHLKEGLEKSKFLFERAEELANIGSWELDYQTGRVTASAGAARVYGIEPSQFSVKAVEQLPLPEFRPLLDKARNELIAHGTPYDVEFQIQRASDGQRRVIHSQAQYDHVNQRLYGVIRDITEEKAALSRVLDFQKELEKQVAERTEALLQSQKELNFAEKLASLGQLSASLAHEVNTPLSAIISATGILTHFFHNQLLTTLEFYAGLTPAQQSQYRRLWQGGLSEEAPADSRLVRRRKLKESWPIQTAPSSEVLEALLDFDLDTVPSDTLSDSVLDLPLVTSVGESLSAARMASIMDTAAQKAVAVVTALRQYLGGATQPAHRFSPEQDLDTALTLLQNQLKQGVTVERRYGGVTVHGSPSELGQVWLNLLSNAVQAMNCCGRLEIETSHEDNWAVIRVIDSGPGIPPELKDKIFEPFFTTKKTGDGLGLGLDICRKIVERHHGMISVESCPGHTCFSVRLPSSA